MRPLLILVVAGKILAVAAWALDLGVPLAAALFFGPDLAVLYHLFMPGAQGLGPVKTRFATSRPEVWLTIDDGPDRDDTGRILDLLDAHGARATFFVVGERAAQHPELIREVVRRGHEVGHHTHTHPAASFWCALPAQVERELDEATAVIMAAAGARPTRFRPPVGIKNLFLFRALARRGLACIGWSVRSRDAVSRNPDQVVALVLRLAQPGAILLLHEGERMNAAVRVQALTGVLAGLSARGLRCVIPTPAQLR